MVKRSYATQIEDEYGKHRFLPTYIAKCEPPPSLDTAEKISKIISKMQWLDFHSLLGAPPLHPPLPSDLLNPSFNINNNINNMNNINNINNMNNINIINNNNNGNKGSGIPIIQSFNQSRIEVPSMSLPMSYSAAIIIEDIVKQNDIHFWTSPNTLLRSSIAPDPSHILLHVLPPSLLLLIIYLLLLLFFY